jgi:hypothetical protein
MIQAVAEDEERGALGMHYTSVPNILKVLNPLFLDDLREKLAEAGDNPRKLLNLRNRMARIRVFDPACGSGNFLVIAYKEMRAIEAEINQRRNEPHRRTDIPLTNFRGIELRDFPAEIARLALIIAEYQCDELYRGQREALQDFLPLRKENWITCGNALRLDWLSICPPTAKGVKLQADDLFGAPLDQAEIDFENEGGKTYVCGNPPYQGSMNQTDQQKRDMENVFLRYLKTYKDLDYVAAFLVKAAEMNKLVGSESAFVTTNSITQGEQVAMLWPVIYGLKNEISFAYKSFRWSNLANNKATVTCVIIGIHPSNTNEKKLFDSDSSRTVRNINPYLIPAPNVIVTKRASAIHALCAMDYGNKPSDAGHLILNTEQREHLLRHSREAASFIRKFVGSRDFIQGDQRWCLWIGDEQLDRARAIPEVQSRIEMVRSFRSSSRGLQAQSGSRYPHRFVYAPHSEGLCIIVPRVFSESRTHMTVGFLVGTDAVISDTAAAVYNADLICFSVLSSRIHLTWIDAVCGKLETRYRYSNTLGWNTFPVPPLTEKNKADLTRCAEDILLAREMHFPTTIADLYDPGAMPANLRAAHDRNDEVLERIYIGRRFRNDTERLEKLFELYTRMTEGKAVSNNKMSGGRA